MGAWGTPIPATVPSLIDSIMHASVKGKLVLSLVLGLLFEPMFNDTTYKRHLEESTFSYFHVLISQSKLHFEEQHTFFNDPLLSNYENLGI